MMNDPGGIRHLDQLQETDGALRVPRSVTAVLVALGAACVVLTAIALGGRTSQSTPAAKPDPLGDLVAKHTKAGAQASSSLDLSPKDVTFPQILSDVDKPSTALAALRSPQPSATASPPALPPPPTDRLLVTPLPAQALLDATPVVTRPRDALTRAANAAGQIESPGSSSESAPAGHDGGYQLQVSSFATQSEAKAFAEQLRARAHKAYIVEAHVPGRGTWYRVRIGPFASQRAASQYRTDFEAREHVVPFIVPPDKPDAGR
ncbi:MAG: SPOR domain-containing protein [Polyangiaceae bacterium]